MIEYIILDTETGGLDPELHDLLEIGLGFVDPTKPNMSLISYIIDYPEPRITVEAMVLNKWDQRMPTELKSKEHKPERIAKEFWDNITDVYSKNREAILIGCNLRFDLKFINAFMSKWFKPKFQGQWSDLVNWHMIDIRDIAHFLRDTGCLPRPQFSYISLSSLAKGLGIKETSKHTALGDISVTWEVYKALRQRATIKDKK
jgi:DNA polymerase III epsilon subunit-like protein